MNPDLKDAFSKIKPICDLVMVKPSHKSIGAFTKNLAAIKDEVVQDLQQYMMFPFITHIKSNEIEKKYELQTKIAEAMRLVLERSKVQRFDMCLQIETGLLGLVFDNAQPGMVAPVPEELKLSTMKCLTALILSLDQQVLLKLLRTQVPLIAQAVFVSVHIAKLDKLRALRLAALHCLMAHTATHPKLTDKNYHIADKEVEAQVVDTLSSILPGVMAALQDVARDSENPGHAIVVAALEATHRILCTTMQDSFAPQKDPVTTRTFVELIRNYGNSREVSPSESKDIVKRSPEWYAMAGEKLTVVTKSLTALATHEHYRVRKELAVLFDRILSECSLTMKPSLPLALDILIAMTKDEYPEVSQFCSQAVNKYFMTATPLAKHEALDSLGENFFATLNHLPRILNNIDASRKLSALNLFHGYIQIMCDEGRPQRLTTALSSHNNMQGVITALLEAATVSPLTSMAQYATRDVTAPPPTNSPWLQLRHCDTSPCQERLQHICVALGGAECAELILDRLLEMFAAQRSPEIAYVVNWMTAVPTSSQSLITRALNTYIEEDVWYLPLEVGSNEAPLTTADTLDVDVYNPRAWIKDSVPELYEGATEIRYTDISYLAPRTSTPSDPAHCNTLAAAQRNMLLSCLLTEGLGIMAKRLKEMYQPFLLKTLCMVLERVGIKYELLHLAGLKAINDIAAAGGHPSVADLIRANADYFTHQITTRLKKAWNSQSALQILSVVMEYSDASILDCLYGIVEDVLVQSCDKYHKTDLQSYLQVFLTFIECISKWFPQQLPSKNENNNIAIDIFKDAMEFMKNRAEEERLLSAEEMERESGKSVEEMYKEDLQKREDELLDYDDRVTEEKPPLPQHIRVTITILKRCIHFIPSRRREETILALQTLTSGLPILAKHEDELLPLVHQCWAPLVGRIEGRDVVVLKRVLELLVTMAAVAKDFIRNRAVKEVLPHIYKYLQKSSSESRLKDVGSAYRSSQAFSLQISALTALPGLAVDLGLQDESLQQAMDCVTPYLSKKQPRPLQALAVKFFQKLLNYDRGATWHHLRVLCNNTIVLQPPEIACKHIDLQPVVGTPYECSDKDFDKNIKLIWNISEQKDSAKCDNSDLTESEMSSS